MNSLELAVHLAQLSARRRMRANRTQNDREAAYLVGEADAYEDAARRIRQLDEPPLDLYVTDVETGGVL